jgi:hypothetical protein
MRTLFEPYPDRLRIADGKLYMADGSSVRKYLREWQASQKIGVDEPLVLQLRSQGEQVRRLASFSLVA